MVVLIMMLWFILRLNFSVTSPPSIITEGTHGGPWRKKTTDLDGINDDKDFPWWFLEYCVLNNRLPPRQNTKQNVRRETDLYRMDKPVLPSLIFRRGSFYLQPCEGSSVQILTKGKLRAPRILRIHKVNNYVIEKMVVEKPVDSLNAESGFSSDLAASQSQHQAVGDGSLRSGFQPWQKLKPSIEILCNDQVRSPEMSLTSVRAYIWKKSDVLVLNYRLVHSR